MGTGERGEHVEPGLFLALHYHGVQAGFVPVSGLVCDIPGLNLIRFLSS